MLTSWENNKKRPYFNWLVLYGFLVNIINSTQVSLYYTIVWESYYGLAFIPCGKQTVVLAI